MKRPNILLIYTDQLRWDALGCNGNPDVQAPNLDALAEQGTNFSHCFVQNPLCMPSRASFLSGQYPSALGITHMGVPVPEDVPVLPHYLSPAGYETANIGKLHFLPHANRDHREPHPSYGFDALEVSDEPGVYEDAYRAWARARDPQQLKHLSVGLPPATHTWYETMGITDTVKHPGKGERWDFGGAVAFPGEDDFTHSAFVAERSKAFLKRQDGRQPFLCVASFYSPHAPWVAPQRFLDLYDPESFTLPEFPAELRAERAKHHATESHLRAARHGYYAMISEVDYYVGTLLDTLEAQGLKDNTLIVFTSDHGDWLGEHLRYGKGEPGDDAVTRVPLLISGPGVAAGRGVSDLVEAVDVLPTLLEAAFLQVPPALQGQSLQPLLRAESGWRPKPALTEFTRWKALRTERHRYYVNASGEEKLWDLAKDPQEYQDVSKDEAYQDVLARHRLELLQKLLFLERPLPRVWPY